MTDTFKATYAGEAEGDVEAFGVTFEEGKSADVPEKYRTKLENNPYFKVGGGSAKADGQSKPTEPNGGKGTEGGDTLPAGPYEAREKSGGWWAIYAANGDEVGKSVREADAAAFNEMNDDDKAAYLAPSKQ